MPAANAYPDRAVSASAARLMSAGAVPRAEAAPLSWCFVGVCFYLVSQAYLVPLWAIGPSWAIWPRLADFAGLAMAAACLWQWNQAAPLSSPHSVILRWLATFVVLATVSLLALSLLAPRLYLPIEGADVTERWGVYQLTRLIQFVLLFACAAYVPLTEARRRWLLALTDMVLWFIVATVLLTYTGSIPYEWVVAHLPESPDVSGPWATFGEAGDGLGLVSYNHAYTACQLLLLYCFRLSLSRSKFGLANLALLMAVGLAIFLSGSRAGFGATLLLYGVYIWNWVRLGHLLPVVWTGTAGCAVVAALFLAPSLWKAERLGEIRDQSEQLVTRQFSTFEGYKSDNLAGRTDIWKMHLEALNRWPLAWIFGFGFGSAVATGNQAHMQPLNMVSETGLVGLLLGSILLAAILRCLWHWEHPGRPILWGTVALLFTAMTQETFYPVAAFGHFLGFYLFTLAIALRMSIDLPEEAGRFADPSVH